MATKSLGKMQRDLLEAILSGVVVHYMPPFPGSKSYFFRSDNRQTVTGIALRLMAKGLVTISGPKDHKTLVATEKGRKWNSA